MKILIVGGFLGSGKTSILLQLAKYVIGTESTPTKVVLIENEIGEVGIDNQLLTNNGYHVEDMFSGCVCCTMTGELISGLQRIMNEYHPELIILESTGVAYPHNIRETIMKFMLDVNCNVTCITDAKRWNRLIKPMEMLLSDQLDSADVIIINKIDLVDQNTLTEVEASIRTYNNTAIFYALSANDPIDEEIFDAMLGEYVGQMI